MRRQFVLRAVRGRRRAGRLVASAAVACALIGGLLAGPPSPAPAAPSPAAPSAAAPSAAAPSPAAKKDDACGTAIEFGRIVDCPGIAPGTRHVYTVTTTVDGERLAAAAGARTRWIWGTLTGPDDAFVCHVFPAGRECVVPKAGTYTLTVTDDAAADTPATAYKLGVDSRTNPSSCVVLPAASFAIPAPGRDDTLPAGSAGNCYRLDQPAGAVLRLDARTQDSSSYISGKVVNASGKVVCEARALPSCVPSGAGPYLLFITEVDGDQARYHLTTRRMSDPDGCAELPLAAYGGPGDRTATGTVDGGVPACLTFPATAGPHLLVRGGGTNVFRQVFDRGGKEMTCTPLRFAQQCALPAAGTYTLVLSDVTNPGRTDFEVAIYPPAGTQGCAPATNGAWAEVTMRSPMQVDCHLVEAVRGDRVQVSSRLTDTSATWLVDGAGTRICGVEAAGCVVTGAAPYRIISVGKWDERTRTGSYDVRVRLLQDAQGCLPVGPGRYGDSPAGERSTNPCRVLTVPAAGRYRVELIDEKNRSGVGTVTDTTGTEVCDGGWCTFPAAGRYTLTARTTNSYATVFLPEAGGPETGCTPVSDDPTAPAQQAFLSDPGEFHCLLLPTPAGSRLALLRPYMLDGDELAIGVQDATGEPVCDSRQLSDDECVLQGTAPFRAVLSQSRHVTDPTGLHALTFVRTGGTPACPVLGAGSFATTPTMNVTFDRDHPVRCFSVPEAGRSTTELISFQDTGVSGPARVSVFGEDGKPVCRTNRANDHFAVCRFTPGTATILVEGAGQFSRYALARRDITGTAAGCPTVGSTAVGAPSSTRTAMSGGDVHCYQVAADAADRLVIGTRDAKKDARTLVLDPSGADAGCAAAAGGCTVTGRTGYQVLVWADVQGFATAAYQLDVWKVWTAGGPPAECTRAPSGAYGFGPYTGTLSAEKPAVCVVMTTRHDDDLGMAITNPATPADGFATGLSAVTGSGGVQACTGDGPFTCPPGKDPVEPTVFLLGLRDRMVDHPYRWEATCATPLCGDSAFTVTAAAPAALIAGGTRTVTIRGTSLHLRDTVLVTPPGRAPITATVTAVSPDRTTLTAQVDLTSAPAGPAAVEVRSSAAGVAPVTLSGVLNVTWPVLRATKVPAITGRVVVGATVTASPGTWTPSTTSYTYRWAANGAVIKGATGRSYVIPATMLGKRLTVTVTAARAGATPGTATSAVSAAVGRGAAAKATKAPTVRGTAKVGRTVTVALGTWSPRPDAYRYEWRVNGTVVRGANRASLKLTTSMRNKRVTVTVIAVRKGHTDGRAQSKAVTVRK